MMHGPFFVYENWRAHGHIATVHRATCPSCKLGYGIHPRASDENGQWLGPYETLDAARAAQLRYPEATRKLCQRCLPQ
jgi:hypothetical protein